MTSDNPVVILRGLRLRCVIGVEPAEAYARQEAVVDLRLRPGAPPQGAVPGADYAAIAARLRAMAAKERFLLLEDLAVRVADILSEEFNIAEMRVRCAKPQVVPGLAEAAVELERSAPARKASSSGGG